MLMLTTASVHGPSSASPRHGRTVRGARRSRSSRSLLRDGRFEPHLRCRRAFPDPMSFDMRIVHPDVSSKMATMLPRAHWETSIHCAAIRICPTQAPAAWRAVRNRPRRCARRINGVSSSRLPQCTDLPRPLGFELVVLCFNPMTGNTPTTLTGTANALQLERCAHSLLAQRRVAKCVARVAISVASGAREYGTIANARSLPRLLITKYF